MTDKWINRIGTGIFVSMFAAVGVVTVMDLSHGKAQDVLKPVMPHQLKLTRSDDPAPTPDRFENTKFEKVVLAPYVTAYDKKTVEEYLENIHKATSGQINRIVSYPDELVPILVTKDRLEKLRKEIPGQFTRLTPDLEVVR